MNGGREVCRTCNGTSAASLTDGRYDVPLVDGECEGCAEARPGAGWWFVWDAEYPEDSGCHLVRAETAEGAASEVGMLGYETIAALHIESATADSLAERADAMEARAEAALEELARRRSGRRHVLQRRLRAAGYQRDAGTPLVHPDARLRSAGGCAECARLLQQIESERDVAAEEVDAAEAKTAEAFRQLAAVQPAADLHAELDSIDVRGLTGGALLGALATALDEHGLAGLADTLRQGGLR